MTPKVRRALVAILVVLLLGQLTAQRLLQRGGTLIGRAASPTGAQRVRPGTLQIGSLTLHACAIGARQSDGLPSMPAWCASFPVPEDWDGHSARRIGLAVAVVPAEAESPSPDVVTFLDGGPGGAATQDYPALAPAFAPLQARHAILLIDQRGTGGSNPLDCSALDQPQRNQPQSDAQSLPRCLQQLQARAAPEFYTTSEAVRDLEAVRRALGAPQLDLIAVSYGTRVAQQYATRFPMAVRSVVLDSPVPNRLALLSEHARNLEHALQLQFARCRSTPACAARFGDPYATLYRLRDRLRATPVAVTLPDPVSFEPMHLLLTAQDLAAVVRFDAYNSLTAALLPLMLNEAQRGNYVPLLGQKTLFTSDLGDQITSGEELSVLCAEDVDLLAPRPEDANTLLGNDAIAQAQAACRLWPRGSRPADFHAPFRSALPVLVLDGELDPVTPPEYGTQIVSELPHARALLAHGQGHGVIGVGCMPRLVQRFVETRDPAGLDASCLSRLGPTPDFIDYDGAAP